MNSATSIFCCQGWARVGEATDCQQGDCDILFGTMWHVLEPIYQISEGFYLKRQKQIIHFSKLTKIVICRGRSACNS